MDALGTGSAGWRTAVSRFHHITVKIIVGKDRASNRCDTDGRLPHAQLLKHFRNKAVNDAVGAAGAVMEGSIGEHGGLFEHHCHFTCPP